MSNIYKVKRKYMGNKEFYFDDYNKASEYMKLLSHNDKLYSNNPGNLWVIEEISLTNFDSKAVKTKEYYSVFLKLAPGDIYDGYFKVIKDEVVQEIIDLYDIDDDFVSFRHYDYEVYDGSCLTRIWKYTTTAIIPEERTNGQFLACQGYVLFPRDEREEKYFDALGIGYDHKILQDAVKVMADIIGRDIRDIKIL